MPKKKTGARKKAEKQKQRQKDIQQGNKSVPITKFPCNFVMVRIITFKNYNLFILVFKNF